VSSSASPWLQEGTDVVAGLGSNPAGGLTAREAARRLERGGPNRLEEARPVAEWRKLLAQLADPLIYLLLAALAVSLVAWVIDREEAAPYDAIVIAAIVVANAVFGYVQGARAEQAVAALKRLAAASATVVRDGGVERVAAEELVPGDVLLVAEGDAVAADARLLEAAALTVAEASLTGESEPVLKQTAALAAPAALGDRTNMVFSGTAVVRGRGRAVVTATGMATEMGNVAGLLGRTQEQATPLEREVEHVGRMLGLAVIAIAALVVAAIFLTSDAHTASDVVSVLLVGVSLAVAAVPEGLPAVLSVVLALGVQRMARQRAIVKRLSSVETLGSASVICTDKTGTLTKSEMTVERVVTASGELALDDAGADVDGALLDETRRLLAAGSLATDAVLRDGRVEGDPTEGAILLAETRFEGLTVVRRSRFVRVGEIPFSSERKLMSVLHADSERDGRIAIAAKGAPDVLLGLCSGEYAAGEVRPLSAERRARLLSTVDRLAEQALRTLGVAYRPLEAVTPPEEDAVERDLVWLGLVGIIDPPRPEARPAIAEAQAAGVRVVMITGDHPRTAARIAADLGIAPAGAPVLRGDELEALDREAREQAVRDVSVYARVAPEHKLRIVDALHRDGAVVAMTGDGVNDAPALKAADIGVAMGITGTDVATEAADMILADDNFATIVGAIREGRGIFANIRRFLRFLLSSNMGEVLTMFFGVVLASVLGLEDTGEAIAVPLLATQILWINLLTDGAPALALGVDAPPGDVMRRRPRRSTDRVIDREMWFGIVWVGLVMAAATLAALELRLPGGLFHGSGTVDEARTMAFTTLVLAQLFNCFNARSDRTSAFVGLFTNRWLWGAIALSALLQVAVVELPFLNHPFGTTPLGLDEWLVCIGLASAVLWADEAKKLAVRLLSARAATRPRASARTG
jgi:calcium-translocating P-type ATPase